MNKLFSRILTASTSALLLISLFSQQAFADSYGMMGSYGGGFGGGWGHMLFGFLMMILFIGGLVLVISLVVRWLGGSSTSRSTYENEKSALDVLNERFAQGKIEKDEYMERKHILSS